MAQLLWVSLCLWAAASDAHAAEPVVQSSRVEEAERYAAQAFDAHRSKEYSRALGLYRKAYDAAPSADILWNMAHLFDVNIGNREQALELYVRYLVHPGAVAERIEKANARLQILRQAARVLRKTNADETATGTGPARGAHYDGGATSGQPFQAKPYWSMPRVTALVVGTGGVAAMVMGTGYGLSAASDSRTAHEECAGNQCRSQRGVDAAKSAAAKATVATLAFSAGAAALAGGCVLWLSIAEPRAERSKTLRALRVAPMTTASSRWGLQMSGAW